MREISPTRINLVKESPSSTSLMDFNHSNLSTFELAENAVWVRDAAKGIGRTLTKIESPRSVMIVAKMQEPELVPFVRQLTKNLLKRQNVFNLKVYVEERFRHYKRFGYQSLLEIDPSYEERLLFWTPEYLKSNCDQIDFIISLGGDGTVLYAAWLFQISQVPPVIPFHFGSLGFLTVFKISEIESVLDKVVGCSKTGVRLNMRMRLSCMVYRKISQEQKLNFQKKSLEKQGTNMNLLKEGPTDLQASEVEENTHSLLASFQILNDIVIDRGPSSYMSQLDLYADDQPLTTVQADGLVISTPTGSTAYSLSAGGSLVHPEVPSFLLTPICAHSLSFRPMLLPDSIELKIQVPLDSRNTAWVSFDGRHRMELRQGDYVCIKLSRFPMPSVCLNDQSSDWFASLKRSLHWNERERQKAFKVKVAENAEEIDQELDLMVLGERLIISNQ